MSTSSYHLVSLSFSANACTMQRSSVQKTWLAQLVDRRVALAMRQETRDRKSYKKQMGEYLVCVSAGDEKGSYGCRIMISLDIPFARKLKGTKVFVKPHQVPILVSTPRLLIVSIQGTAIKVLVVSAHAPHQMDNDGPRWWAKLSTYVRHYLKNQQLVIGIDANIDNSESCDPHVGSLITNRKSAPKYQYLFIAFLRAF